MHPTNKGLSDKVLCLVKILHASFLKTHPTLPLKTLESHSSLIRSLEKILTAHSLSRTGPWYESELNSGAFPFLRTFSDVVSIIREGLAEASKLK